MLRVPICLRRPTPAPGSFRRGPMFLSYSTALHGIGPDFYGSGLPIFMLFSQFRTRRKWSGVVASAVAAFDINCVVPILPVCRAVVELRYGSRSDT